MHKTSRIYVAGHTGMVGSAIVRLLDDLGYTNVVTRSSLELDLTQQRHVDAFFAMETPEYVFLAAAKVGGIHANDVSGGDFIYTNTMIQANVIHASKKYNVKKLVFLGSSCVYPKECPQPIREDSLMSGPLEPTNRPYAVAKIAGIELCRAYKKQFGCAFVSAMPTNLTGPNDRYDQGTSHVFAALIRKFHEAKASNAPSVVVWGTGVPRREFLHVDDLARALLIVMDTYDDIEPINIGCGSDISIDELAILMKNIIGYDGDIVYDPSMPDGTLRKCMDSSKMISMGWTPEISLTDMILRAFDDYDRAR
jgi:GDP-L-fucose synthase